MKQIITIHIEHKLEGVDEDYAKKLIAERGKEDLESEIISHITEFFEEEGIPPESIVNITARLEEGDD